MSSSGLRPDDLEDVLGGLLDDPRARVVVLVDAVAEAHQALVALLHALDEVGDVVAVLDAPQHPQHGLVGAAVQRAVERGDAGRDGRVGIGLRRADRAHRARRAVLLVVGVQDEQDVERAFQARIGLVLQLGHLVHHVQEVARVREVVVGIDVRLALGVAVGERRQRRHLGDQPDRLDVTVLRVVDVRRLGIERRQRADRAEQHAHRVRVVAEATEELLDVLVHERVDRDLVLPVRQLRGGRQLAVDEQVGDLEIGRLLGELLDRVAAVLEDAVRAVEVRHRRAAGGRVHECRVVRHEAEVVLVDADRAEVQRAYGAVDDRDLVRPARAVVGDASASRRRSAVGSVGRRGWRRC